jgi:shikimate kinase
MKNIILIGMPNSGKSTVGEALARHLGMGFVDTDLLIRQKANNSPRDIVTHDGLDKFLEIQESVILALNKANSVISTGGSVIYGEASMSYLKECGVIIFLQVEFEIIEQRVSEARRFARDENQSLRDIYDERLPLYNKYADYKIDCTDRQIEEIISDIKRDVVKNDEFKKKLK